MGETGAEKRTPSENLLEALKAYVGEVALTNPAASAPTGGSGQKRATWLDIFIFLLFACDLAMIVWSVPEEWLKSTQLEFARNVVPVLGGGLFTLVAAWYKEKALSWTGSIRFRLFQIPLTAFAVILAVPILPVSVLPAPDDAVLFVDNKDAPDHLRPCNHAFRVTLHDHSFILNHQDDTRNASSEQFDLKWTRLVALFFRGKPLELSMVYPFRFTSMDTSGVSVQITRLSGPFAEDFRREDILKKYHLEPVNDKTLRITLQLPAGGEESSLPTHLPVGSYEAVSSKRGCEASERRSFEVLAVQDSSRSELLLPELKCQP